MNWMILPLKRYADFRGRSRRKEYWMYVLFQIIVYTVLVVGTFAITGAAMQGGRGASANPFALMASFGIAGLVIVLFWLGTLVPSLAVAVRRLHDTNRSGWWLLFYAVPYLVQMLITLALIGSIGSTGAPPSAALSLISGLASLVSFIGAIVLLVFMVLPGTPGMNRFGSDPKDPKGDLVQVFG